MPGSPRVGVLDVVGEVAVWPRVRPGSMASLKGRERERATRMATGTTSRAVSAQQAEADPAEEADPGVGFGDVFLDDDADVRGWVRRPSG